MDEERAGRKIKLTDISGRPVSADTKTSAGQIVYGQKKMWTKNTGSVPSEHVSIHINEKIIFAHLIFTSRTTCEKCISFVKRVVTKNILVWFGFYLSLLVLI